MTCPECHKPDRTIGVRSSRRNHLCISCDIDANQTEIVAGGGFVINGQVYRVGSELSHDKGFGGRLYTIAAFDGRTVTTTNLQAIGMTAKIPDNAAFTTHPVRLAA